MDTPRDENYMRLRPAGVSEEEWEDIVNDLRERKVDNSNHETVQWKLETVLKVMIPLIAIPVIGLGVFLATQYQAMLYTGLGIVVVIMFLYIAGVEVATGKSGGE